jgi:hypothetical protein
MVSSETPNTVTRLILGTIVAVIASGILIGLFSGVAGDGVSGQEEELEDFVKDVNRVCNDEQGTNRNYLELQDYRINRSQSNMGEVMLVNANEEIQSTMMVECSISNQFSVTNNYIIEEDGRNSVTVSEQSLSSQIGDSDE